MTDNNRVPLLRAVVVGGGYAGTMAANRLVQRPDAEVTLINPRPDFVERIRLHQLLGGTHDAVHDFAAVLSPRVRLVADTATRIDAADRAVELLSGGALAYDYLVCAVGSAGSAPRVPGAAEFAHAVSTLEGALAARAALEAAPSPARVTVIGAGPTGIETAAELAEQGRRVTLVCGDALGPYLHPRARRALAERLRALGVTVMDGSGSRADEVRAAVVRLEDGREVPIEVTLWTVGFGVPQLAAASGLSTDAAGRLLTDETLTMFQFASTDDHAKNAHIDGWAGARVKQFICWYTYRQRAFEGRHPGILSWVLVKDRERRAMLAARAREAAGVA